MKKITIITIILFSIMIKVNATSNFSISKSKVTVGDTFNVTVSLTDVAAWNIHVNLTGPVENCDINDVNVTEDAENTNKVISNTCRATKEGTITIKLSGDVTSEDGITENLSGTETVTVIKKVNVPDIAMNSSIICFLVGIIAFIAGFIITYLSLKKKNNNN